MEKIVNIRLSDNQLEKLDQIVEFFGSTRPNVIKRGVQLIKRFNIPVKDFKDSGNKNNNVKIGVFDSEIQNIINELTSKLNMNYSDVLRYGIEIQYNTLEAIRSLEKQLYLEKKGF